MSLYFSRLTLNPDPSTRALAQLLNPRDESEKADAHHRLVWTVFSDGTARQRDFLWRYDGKGRFFTLSARPPKAHDLFLPPESKAFEPDLRRGDRLIYTLRANATRTVKGKRITPSGKRVRKHLDLMMDLLFAVPKEDRSAERMKMAQTAAEAWMARQGAAKGFAPVETVVDGYTTLELKDDKAKSAKRKNRPRLGILDLAGEIEVTDPALFLPALAQGFGRAKAWGCGLMLIRRAG